GCWFVVAILRNELTRERGGEDGRPKRRRALQLLFQLLVNEVCTIPGSSNRVRRSGLNGQGRPRKSQRGKVAPRDALASRPFLEPGDLAPDWGAVNHPHQPLWIDHRPIGPNQGNVHD